MDNRRNNDLTGLGWAVLRFNGEQIREAASDYCLPKIVESINRLGGLATEGLVPRVFDPDNPESRQLMLFEATPDYEVD